MRVIKPGIICIAIVLASVPVLGAQQPKEAPPAPVPAQISTAKKVFISNAGVDAIAASAFNSHGLNPNQAYDGFYAAMKAWGRYELVPAPNDADLVFEISFADPEFEDLGTTSYVPQLRLTIIDAKTHFKLWTLAEPVKLPLRKAAWNKNFAQGMVNLMADIKKLAGQTAANASGK